MISSGNRMRCLWVMASVEHLEVDSRKQSCWSCLKGLEPKNIDEWNKGNWTSGYVRSKPLQCERINSGSESGKDGFAKLEQMKVPDSAQ